MCGNSKSLQSWWWDTVFHQNNNVNKCIPLFLMANHIVWFIFNIFKNERFSFGCMFKWMQHIKDIWRSKSWNAGIGPWPACWHFAFAHEIAGSLCGPMRVLPQDVQPPCSHVNRHYSRGMSSSVSERTGSQRVPSLYGPMGRDRQMFSKGMRGVNGALFHIWCPQAQLAVLIVVGGCEANACTLKKAIFFNPALLINTKKEI